MVTTRDIWYIEDLFTTHVSDVMTPRDRLVTSHGETSLEEARSILFRNRIRAASRSSIKRIASLGSSRARTSRSGSDLPSREG